MSPNKKTITILMTLTLLSMGCSETNSEPGGESRTDAQPATLDGGVNGQDTGLDRGDGSVPDAEVVPEGALTYWADVVPILDQSCMGCHKAGGVAPMKFETYDEVRTWGPAIVASTQARTMPPWFAKADGTCGDFADSEWLSESALETLATWVDQGMFQGTPTERTQPTYRSLDATHSFMTPEFFPERQGGLFAQFDEYRCFRYTFDESDQDRFLTGYEVLPGNEAIVHHVIGIIVNPERESGQDGLTNAQQMQALADESPDREGWPCFVGAGEGVREVSEPIAWAPGQGVMKLPSGTGVRVKPGFELVLQVHYNLADDAQVGSSDQSMINVRLEDEVETPLRPVYIDYLLEDFQGNYIPPRETNYEFIRDSRFGNRGGGNPLKIWGILPHMHERGQMLNATILKANSDETECAVQVDNWDFAWQRTYWYERPLEVTPDDKWQISCTYNTENDGIPILPGWGTRNEMCLTVLYVSTNLDATETP